MDENDPMEPFQCPECGKRVLVGEVGTLRSRVECPGCDQKMVSEENPPPWVDLD